MEFGTREAIAAILRDLAGDLAGDRYVDRVVFMIWREIIIKEGRGGWARSSTTATPKKALAEMKNYRDALAALKLAQHNLSATSIAAIDAMRARDAKTAGASVEQVREPITSAYPSLITSIQAAIDDLAQAAQPRSGRTADARAGAVAFELAGLYHEIKGKPPGRTRNDASPFANFVRAVFDQAGISASPPDFAYRAATRYRDELGKIAV